MGTVVGRFDETAQLACPLAASVGAKTAALVPLACIALRPWVSTTVLLRVGIATEIGALVLLYHSVNRLEGPEDILRRAEAHMAGCQRADQLPPELLLVDQASREARDHYVLCRALAQHRLDASDTAVFVRGHARQLAPALRAATGPLDPAAGGGEGQIATILDRWSVDASKRYGEDAFNDTWMGLGLDSHFDTLPTVAQVNLAPIRDALVVYGHATDAQRVALESSPLSGAGSVAEILAAYANPGAELEWARAHCRLLTHGIVEELISGLPGRPEALYDALAAINAASDQQLFSAAQVRALNEAFGPYRNWDIAGYRTMTACLNDQGWNSLAANLESVKSLARAAASQNCPASCAFTEALENSVTNKRNELREWLDRVNRGNPTVLGWYGDLASHIQDAEILADSSSGDAHLAVQVKLWLKIPSVLASLEEGSSADRRLAVYWFCQRRSERLIVLLGAAGAVVPAGLKDFAERWRRLERWMLVDITQAGQELRTTDDLQQWNERWNAVQLLASRGSDTVKRRIQQERICALHVRLCLVSAALQNPSGLARAVRLREAADLNHPLVNKLRESVTEQHRAQVDQLLRWVRDLDFTSEAQATVMPDVKVDPQSPDPTLRSFRQLFAGQLGDQVRNVFKEFGNDASIPDPTQLERAVTDILDLFGGSQKREFDRTVQVFIGRIPFEQRAAIGVAREKNKRGVELLSAALTDYAAEYRARAWRGAGPQYAEYLRPILNQVDMPRGFNQLTLLYVVAKLNEGHPNTVDPTGLCGIDFMSDMRQAVIVACGSVQAGRFAPHRYGQDAVQQLPNPLRCPTCRNRVEAQSCDIDYLTRLLASQFYAHGVRAPVD